MDKEVNIKDLITGVRRALYEVDKERIDKNERALFQIKDFSLEINFVVREDNREQGEFQAKVITIGNERQYSSETIQKITLHMVAISPIKESAGPSPATLPTDEEHVIGSKPGSEQGENK